MLLLFVSCVRSTSAIRFAIVECACLFSAYLVFAQPPEWVVYYAELLPMLHSWLPWRLFGCSRRRRPSRESLRSTHESRVGFNHRGDRAPSVLSWRPGAGACTD